MLAVTGTRSDGFHDLVSLVAPVASLADFLTMEIFPSENSERAPDVLECDATGVPTDSSNLVLKTAEEFRRAVPAFPRVRFVLEKKIPQGAGLGGGSSDAAAALKLMSEAVGEFAPSANSLRKIAAKIGSDVPLFLSGTPVVMRGRGEKIESLSSEETAAVFAKQKLIFKPAFGVSTAEAYGAMKRSAPKFYTPADEAERRLAAWRADPKRVPLPLFNDMEAPVFEKHVALPTLFKILRERFGLDAHMSGSGSACFVGISEKTNVQAVSALIRECLGETAFVHVSS